ncbi:MAG: hypothetical protein L7T84_12910 [Akkermansiaceae bacterium]|nr:hypothetical protein [Akkermansiaceae bacterium]
MGINETPPPASPLSSSSLSALDIPDPHDQHYDFAHKPLVKAMAGKGFLEALQKKKRLYLKKLWKEAGKQPAMVKKSPQPA